MKIYFGENLSVETESVCANGVETFFYDGNQCRKKAFREVWEALGYRMLSISSQRPYREKILGLCLLTDDKNSLCLNHKSLTWTIQTPDFIANNIVMTRTLGNNLFNYLPPDIESWNYTVNNFTLENCQPFLSRAKEHAGHDSVKISSNYRLWKSYYYDDIKKRYISYL